MAAVLRRQYPQARLYFCSSGYTRSLVAACEYFAGFIDMKALIADPSVLAGLNIDVLLNLQSDPDIARAAAEAGVPIRVTNLRRLGGMRHSNRFVIFSRTNSPKHSVDLNLRMLSAIGVRSRTSPEDWPTLFGLSSIPPLDESIGAVLDPCRFNLVLHPKSGGHGREWPGDHFRDLVNRLPSDQFKIFVTGTEKEEVEVMRDSPSLLAHPRVTNLMGKFTLVEFLSFLKAVDGLVGSGTGPLHLAAALGRHVIGIFPPRRSMDLGKWGPIGVRAQALTVQSGCSQRSWKCGGQPDGPPCACTIGVEAARVAATVQLWSGRREQRENLPAARNEVLTLSPPLTNPIEPAFAKGRIPV